MYLHDLKFRFNWDSCICLAALTAPQLVGRWVSPSFPLQMAQTAEVNVSCLKDAHRVSSSEWITGP